MARKKITSLTSTQEATLAESVASWVETGYSTERCDREACEVTWAGMYAKLGEPRPLVLWLDSPLACIVAWGLLSSQLDGQLRGQLGGQLDGQLRGQLGGQLRGQLGGQLYGQLYGQLGGQLRGQLDDQLYSQLYSQLDGQLGGQLDGQLRGQLDGQLGGQLGGQLRVQLDDQLYSQLGGQLRGQLDGQLYGQLRGQLDDQLRGQLGGQLRGQLDGQLDGQLGGQLGGQLRVQLDDQLYSQLRGQLDDQLRGQLDGQLRGQLDGQLRGQLGGQLRGQLDGQLYGQLRGQLDGQLRGQLDGQLRGQLDGQLGGQLRVRWGGGWWSYWPAFYSWPEIHLADQGFGYKAEASERLALWRRDAEEAHWWFPYKPLILASDRPSTLTVDEEGRLHNETGPALAYGDGYGLYAWHGVRLDDARVIEEPANLDPRAILKEENAEVRRVMMERFGFERLIRETDAKLVASDEFGRLHRIMIRGDEPLVMVEVVNSTPEPDGSFRDYWLRVDPSCQTALEAVAWTFDVPPVEYELAAET